MHHFLPTETGLVKVCKVMFLNTFDLSEKRMRNIIDKRRRENQEVLGADDDSLGKAAVDVKSGSKEAKVDACQEGMCMSRFSVCYKMAQGGKIFSKFA